MASAYDYPLRPELQITRTTLLSGAFTQGGTTNEHYKTATNSSYRPLSHEGARGDKSVVHKNLSQLPGFNAPPSRAEHFGTTSQMSYGAPNKTPVGTSRHGAVFKEKMERRDIFGNDMSKVSKRREPILSTTTAMGYQSASARLEPSPRLVHGGSFRGLSRVPLDRNAVGPNAPVPDFKTTTHAAFEQSSVVRDITGASTVGSSFSASSRQHRYELPQKNASTFLATSMVPGVHPPPSPINPLSSRARGDPSARTSVGKVNGVAEFVTETDHARAQPGLYSHPPPGYNHYVSANHQHYGVDRPSSLYRHAPPGKGGVDMTKSTIPLGRDHYPMQPSHTHAEFLGMPGERRATCSSRGTLGTRGL